MTEGIKWNLDDFLFIQVSEPKKFQEGANQKRQGFAKIAFNKQYYVTVTLTDHSNGHGVVKSVILRNAAPEFIAKIKSPEYWEIQKRTVTLVTENGAAVDRVFRIVVMQTPSGGVIMSNNLETQLRNLATNATITIDGAQEKILGYKGSDGKIVSLLPKDESKDDDDDDDDGK